MGSLVMQEASLCDGTAQTGARRLWQCPPRWRFTTIPLPQRERGFLPVPEESQKNHPGETDFNPC